VNLLKVWQGINIGDFWPQFNIAVGRLFQKWQGDHLVFRKQESLSGYPS
jgi:hypothetical protein